MLKDRSNAILYLVKNGMPCAEKLGGDYFSFFLSLRVPSKGRRKRKNQAAGLRAPRLRLRDADRAQAPSHRDLRRPRGRGGGAARRGARRAAGQTFLHPILLQSPKNCLFI